MKTTNIILASAALFTAMLTACEKPQGACEVDYDMAGHAGKACTVVREEECVDNVSPSINMLTTTKKKAFTENKTCADAGYATTACPDVPLAWAFEGGCPR